MSLLRAHLLSLPYQAGGAKGIDYVDDERPDIGHGRLDRRHPLQYLVALQAVIAPAAAAGAGVLQQRLQSIERVREPRLGTSLRFELLPQNRDVFALVGRQQSENAAGGGDLALRPGGLAGEVVGEGVAGIDLDKIVDGQHLEHAQQVDVAL
jgi:hypothetical protein